MKVNVENQGKRLNLCDRLIHITKAILAILPAPMPYDSNRHILLDTQSVVLTLLVTRPMLNKFALVDGRKSTS